MTGSAAGGIKPWRPGGVRVGSGIAVGVAILDGCDWTPEQVAVLGVPYRDSAIGYGEIHQREQVRVLRECKTMAGGKLKTNPDPDERRIAVPENDEVRLVLASPRSTEDTHDLGFVVVARVLRAGEGVRRRNAKLRWPLKHPWRNRS